jgi:hypothetical protein
MKEGGLPELVRTLAESLGTRGYSVSAAEPLYGLFSQQAHDGRRK